MLVDDYGRLALFLFHSNEINKVVNTTNRMK